MSAEDATPVVADKSTSASPKEPKPPSTKPPTSSSAGDKTGTGSKPAASGSGSFKVDDVVLARLKGYPPWPARIADTNSLPAAVLQVKPTQGQNYHPVQYFPVGDFSWLHSKDIKPLSKADITSFLSAPHRKPSGGLKEAYEVARDPTDWAKEQEEERRRREQQVAQEDVDELAEDEEPATGGKRKKTAVDKKGAKKAKTAKSAPAGKEKKAAKKESESEANAEAPPAGEDDLQANDPECKLVKAWRHKLQRVFLGKDPIVHDEMDKMDELFTKIETHRGMTIEALQYSKIGKVMRKITTLDTIPRNDELKITDRAAKLMNEWHEFIAGAANGAANGEAKETPAEAPAPTTA